MSEGGGSKFGYLLAGLGIGALVGVLTAPRRGEDSRALLSQKTDEAKKYTQQRGREWQEWAERVVERGKQRAERQMRSISAAVDAGRKAYQKASRLAA